MNKKISVCLLGCQSFDQRSISSILDQTEVEMEVIAAFSAGSETKKPFTASGVEWRSISTDCNVYNMANACIQASSGAFIKFLRPGDRILPGALQSFLSAANDSSAVLLSAPVRYLSDDGVEITRTWNPAFVGRAPGKDVLSYSVENLENKIGTLTSVFFRRDAAFAGFDENFLTMSDFVAWLKILSHGDYYGFSKPLMAAPIYDHQSESRLLNESLLSLCDFKRFAVVFREYSQWLGFNSEDWEKFIEKQIFETFSNTVQEARLTHAAVKEAVGILSLNKSKEELAYYLGEMSALVFDLLISQSAYQERPEEEYYNLVSPELLKKVRSLQRELDYIGNSASWKSTELLRRTKSLFNRAFNKSKESALPKISRLEPTNAEIAALNEIKELEGLIHSIRFSLSWKLSAPLRTILDKEKISSEIEENLLVSKLQLKSDSVNYLVPQVTSLVVFDDFFPCKLSAFRYQEYLTYLQQIENSCVLSTGASITSINSRESFKSAYEDFSRQHPELASRVVKLQSETSVKPQLAYCVFLSLVYQYLSYFESNQIPFVFTLYPGGTFFLNDSATDQKLAEVMSSPMFRKVITTQRLTTDYLLTRGFCRAEQILEVIGGVFPNLFEKSTFDHKLIYKTNKNTLDVCFVAYKYSKHGIEKGYDRFINLAHKLAPIYPDLFFHVVGGFSENDLDVFELQGKIKFYGTLESGLLAQFYQSMDMIVSPNVSNFQINGRFDGFPTGACIEAGMSGVAVFCTDSLKQNVLLKDGEDFILLSHDDEANLACLKAFLDNPDKIYGIAQQGMKRFRECFGVSAQMEPRLKLLTTLLNSPGEFK